MKRLILVTVLAFLGMGSASVGNTAGEAALRETDSEKTAGTKNRVPNEGTEPRAAVSVAPKLRQPLPATFLAPPEGNCTTSPGINGMPKTTCQ